MSTHVLSGAAHLEVTARAKEIDAVASILTATAHHGLSIAPNVVARLHTRLHGDLEAIVQVATLLTAAERRGARFLPDPLPLVPAISESFRAIDLEPWEQEVLLAATLYRGDRFEVLLRFAGRSLEDMFAGSLAQWLTVAAGRHRWVDPSIRIWVHERAPLMTRMQVHRRLSEVHAEFGDDLRRDWHRAQSSLERDETLAPPLVALAQQVFHSGECERAFAIARVAAAHAADGHLIVAQQIAGSAALGAGCVDDAVQWLGTAYEQGNGHERADVLARFLAAQTFAQGAPPTLDIPRLKPSTDDPQQWRAWAHAAALVAGLAAERGAWQEARAWIAQARAVGPRAHEGGMLPAATSWMWLLAGDEPEDEMAAGAGPLAGTVYLAMRSALDGDIAGGLRLLADEDLRAVEDDSLITGFERTPLLAAYRAVAEALLHLWAGDLQTARETLLRASTQAPVVLPFAGLASTLLRRIEYAVTGQESVYAGALRCVESGRGSPPDQLVDRAIHAYLDGDVEAAAVQIALWHERGAPRGCFGLPDLDEVGPLIDIRVLEPADIALARRLRHRVRAARARAWEVDLEGIADEGRSIRSGFERARVECLLGTAYVQRGDRGAGARHLLAAESLFTLSGAEAWARAARTRLHSAAQVDGAPVRPVTEPVRVIRQADPLATCRAAWEPVLTPRELAAAMLIAEGATNREIADRLSVSVRTVEVYVGRVFQKLDVRTRAELTVLAYRTALHA